MAPFLWSYDLAKLNLEKDKKRIITNTLNYGTKEATDRLFSAFCAADIREAVTSPLPGEWNKKSINFWTLMLNVPFSVVKIFLKEQVVAIQ